MVQNLKVDVIYHLTSSDFEMEFNLCGCCRMRLLSDKTTDKKTFIKALARDVSRSRVIIACGPLFSNDGLIKTVATAIGSSTVLCNNKTYGIKGEEQISIINGSTPLVTPDGYFGGCIIESGPQTIILLTENKAFRKAIMQNLIHPYIEEISYIPTKNSPIASPVVASVPEPEISAVPSYITETDTSYHQEESVEDAYAELPVADNEHNIEFIMDGSDESEQAEEIESAPVFDDTYKMYTEVEPPEEIDSRYAKPYTPSESDNMFISNSETYDEEDYQRSRRSLDITIVVLILLILLAILSLVYFVVVRPTTMGIGTGEYLKQIFGIANAFIYLL